MHEETERIVSNIFFVANLIVLISASVILYYHSNFLHDYRVGHYQKVNGTYTISDDDEYWFDTGSTDCSQREKYLGQWNVVTQSNGFSLDEIFTFKRNGKVESKPNLWDGFWWRVIDETYNKYKIPTGRELVEYQLSDNKPKFGSVDFIVENCESLFCTTEWSQWLLELGDKQILMMEYDYRLNKLSGEFIVLEREESYKQLEFVP